jgi:acylphosphatase
MNPVKARTWVVSGRVQGVGFRYFVQRTASSLGLKGWTRNLADGNVEVYAAGPEKQLADLAAALYRGPEAAVVRSVDEREAVVQNLSGFFVR